MWKCTGTESGIRFDEVELDGEWTEYDEKVDYIASLFKVSYTKHRYSGKSSCANIKYRQPVVKGAIDPIDSLYLVFAALSSQ